MFETQISETLNTKFPGVESSIIDRVAKKLGKTVTSAEQVQTVVDGVTFQMLLQSYGDSRATEAQQTAVSNYEAKHGLKDGVKINTGGAATTSPANNPTKSNVGGAADPSESNAVLEAIKKLTDRLDRMDSERTTKSRKQQLDAVIDKLPENLRKGYSRISLDSLKDEEFTSLLSEIATEVDSIVNSQVAKGAVFSRPTVKGVSPKSQGAKEATDDEVNAVIGKMGL